MLFDNQCWFKWNIGHHVLCSLTMNADLNVYIGHQVLYCWKVDAGMMFQNQLFSCISSKFTDFNT